MSPESVRAAYERVRGEVGPSVTVVVATKYVSLQDMAVLVEAGVEVVGENRAQDLERKHAEYGDAFRWHFIGHLQSNKVKVVNERCELVHSLGSESAARRLEVPALVEVNLGRVQAAIDAGGSARYSPAINDGKAIRFHVAVKIGIGAYVDAVTVGEGL